MKVLVFTSLYPNNVWPERGVFIRERVRHYARAGDCEAKVVAPVPYVPRWLPGPYAAFSQVSPAEALDGIEVLHPRYFLIPKVGMTVHGWAMYRSVLSAVLAVKRRFDAEVLDAHYVYPDGFAAARLARRLDLPFVVSARGTDINLFPSFPLIRRQIVSTLRAAAGIIAVSKSLQDAMVSLGIARERIAVIPNGVDPAKFHPISREDARRALGLPAGRWILCVGHLNPNKGFDLAIDAVARLSADGGFGDVRLAIAGDGPFRAHLAGMIASRGVADRVRLIGHVAHADLRAWYGAADLFCLASAMEGMPNALLEALACGVPVVATAAGGVPEVIRSDRVGILTERTGAGLATAFRNALGMTWDRAGIAAFAGQWSWDRAAGDVLRVFERAREAGVERRGPRPDQPAARPGREADLAES